MNETLTGDALKAKKYAGEAAANRIEAKRLKDELAARDARIAELEARVAPPAPAEKPGGGESAEVPATNPPAAPPPAEEDDEEAALLVEIEERLSQSEAKKQKAAVVAIVSSAGAFEPDQVHDLLVARGLLAYEKGVPVLREGGENISLNQGNLQRLVGLHHFKSSGAGGSGQPPPNPQIAAPFDPSRMSDFRYFQDHRSEFETYMRNKSRSGDGE